MQMRDPARAEIVGGERSEERPGCRKQALCALRRLCLCRPGEDRVALVAGRWRQGEEALCFLDGLAKAGVAPVQADQVEKVAMLPGRGIDPVTDCPALGFEQPHIETAPGRSGHISDHPVTPLAPARREVMAADGLHVAGKPLGQFGRAH